MHWKDLRAIGETEQRLYSLDAWVVGAPGGRTSSSRINIEKH
jgi:hypothetical protein